MTTPYLYANPNPNAPRRDNGIRFYGYPGRTARPTILAVHTTESLLDLTGPDGGAESVARYQATTNVPSSYHRIVDRDSTLVMLPDEATSFGVVGYNSRALSVALAMRAADWADPVKARAARPALERLAAVLAEWCARWNIEPRLLTKAQADAGWDGITGHGVLDPARRSDPGASFPWSLLLELVRAILAGGVTPAPDPTPLPPPAETDPDPMRYVLDIDRGRHGIAGPGFFLHFYTFAEIDAYKAAGLITQTEPDAVSAFEWDLIERTVLRATLLSVDVDEDAIVERLAPIVTAAAGQAAGLSREDVAAAVRSVLGSLDGPPAAPAPPAVA